MEESYTPMSIPSTDPTAMDLLATRDKMLGLYRPLYLLDLHPAELAKWAYQYYGRSRILSCRGWVGWVGGGDTKFHRVNEGT